MSSDRRVTRSVSRAAEKNLDLKQLKGQVNELIECLESIWGHYNGSPYSMIQDLKNGRDMLEYVTKRGFHFECAGLIQPSLLGLLRASKEFFELFPWLQVIFKDMQYIILKNVACDNCQSEIKKK